MSVLSFGGDKWRIIAIVLAVVLFFVSQNKTIIIPEDTKWLVLGVGGFLFWWINRKTEKFPATYDGACALLEKHLHGPYGPGPAHANIKFEKKQIFPLGTGVGSYFFGEYLWMDNNGAEHKRVAIMQSTEQGLVDKGDVAFISYQALAKEFEKSELLKAGIARDNVLNRAGRELLNDTFGLNGEEEKTTE